MDAMESKGEPVADIAYGHAPPEAVAHIHADEHL